MKQLLFILLSFLSLNTSAQKTETNFDGKKWQAPYHLDEPEAWDIERFLIPISFALSIKYKGG